MIIADVIIVVSGGIVQAVYAPSQTKIQIIDFDNLKEGDVFSLDELTEPDGPPDGAAALGDIAEALELTARNVREDGDTDDSAPDSAREGSNAGLSSPESDIDPDLSSADESIQRIAILDAIAELMKSSPVGLTEASLDHDGSDGELLFKTPDGQEWVIRTQDIRPSADTSS